MSGGPPSPAAGRQLGVTLRVALVLVVLAAGLWAAWPHAGPLYHRGGDLRLDCDTNLLVAGLQAKPHFLDTFDWWHGIWAGIVPFFRPVSSQLFWLEYQAFGPNGLAGFTAVHVASHLVMLLAGLFLLAPLLGWRRGLLAVAVFALHLADWLQLPVAVAALPSWKDSVDIWCATGYVTSLGCYLRYLRGGGRGWWAGAFITGLLALGCKEMAYTLPLALALLAWHERRLGARWRSLLPFALLVPALFAWRWSVLGGMGYHFGTNNMWFYRLADRLTGPLAAGPLAADGLPWAVVLAVGAVWLAATRRRFAWAAVSAAGAAGLLVATAAGLNASVLDIALRLFEPLPWEGAAATGLLAVLGWRLLRDRPRTQILAYGLVVTSQLPLTLAPFTQHALYLVAFMWAAWLTIAVLDAARAWAQGLRQELRKGGRASTL